MGRPKRPPRSGVRRLFSGRKAQQLRSASRSVFCLRIAPKRDEDYSCLAISMYGNVQRLDFAKIQGSIQIPNLIEVQMKSYQRFLQMDLPAKRAR